jgi:hypothetical protein
MIECWTSIIVYQAGMKVNQTRGGTVSLKTESCNIQVDSNSGYVDMPEESDGLEMTWK